MIGHHPFDVQVFNRHPAIISRQAMGELMQGVVANVRNVPVQPGQTLGRLLSVGRALDLAAMRPGQAA